jgi:hypothetical protein
MENHTFFTSFPHLLGLVIACKTFFYTTPFLPPCRLQTLAENMTSHDFFFLCSNTLYPWEMSVWVLWMGWSWIGEDDGDGISIYIHESHSSSQTFSYLPFMHFDVHE